jgi:hypothetical protein
MSQTAYIQDLLNFCDHSMKWCTAESEKAAAKVGDTFQSIMSDAKRVSKMSEDTLKAVGEFKANLRKMADDQGGKPEASTLIEALTKLCKEHVELNDFAFPVVEALQFQDRIRQNMENLNKMLSLWTQNRSKLQSATSADSIEMVEFGNQLLDRTTMAEERDIIRQMIPGVRAEQKQDEGLFF